MIPFDVIGFDADDTLWHNELLYMKTQNRFVALLGTYSNAEQIVAKLDETEARNIRYFGYGIKSFTLSLIETAIDLSDGQISAKEIHAIIDFARDMLTSEVQLLDAVAEAISTLASQYRLMLITKGDLLDQESKLARSGLASYFQDVEIISDKDSQSYQRILQRHGLAPQRFMMVGNSLRSDILPVLGLGGSAVYIPFEVTWAHELAETPPAEQAGFYILKTIAELPQLLSSLA